MFREGDGLMCFVCGCTGDRKIDLRFDPVESSQTSFAEQLVDDPLEELIRTYEKLYRRSRELSKQLDRQDA